jgi:hypothetical protein
MATLRPEPLGVGYFGSYARGDWGVGSDLNLLLIVEHAAESFLSRGAPWDTTGLPVPAGWAPWKRPSSTTASSFSAMPGQESPHS